MNRKVISALLALVMAVCLTATGCTDSNKDVTELSIANVSSETIKQITSDMTKTQLRKLLGETYGEYNTGKNSYLATYIVDNNYIYSVSFGENDDEAIGYDGTALMNSLEGSRVYTTSGGAVVSAETNYEKDEGEGFIVNVNYSGKYTCSMDGYKLYSAGNEVLPEDEMTGKNKIIVDVLNPEETTAAPTTAADTTAADTTAADTTATGTTASAAVIVPGVLSIGGEGTDDETTTEPMLGATAPNDDTTVAEETTSGDALVATAPDDDTTAQSSSETTTAAQTIGDGVNARIGMLKIATDAGESVYVEIYSIGGQLFIARVRT